MTYAEQQKALAETPGGLVASTMTPGSRWTTPEGETVTVWFAWVPGDASDEARAAKYKWTLAPNHNTEIGVTSRRHGTQRVKVEDLGEWVPG